MSLPATAVVLALVFLGVDPVEGEDPNKQLEDKLAEYNIDLDQFLTKETMFACGYHRGLQNGTFDVDDSVPTDGENTDAELVAALSQGYAFGLDGREIVKTPPPSLVFAAAEAGDLTWGGFASWLESVDLTECTRLGHALTVGSGKEAVTVPAGTPVDVIAEIEKDGVPHVIVSFDGLPLLVPNPEDSPNIVSGDTEVVPEKKRRSSKRKSSGGGKKRERGPTLRQAVVDVIEGKDGGPGPLQSDGSFAGRVFQRCTELGIGDKATKFMAKATKHVPYYLNGYKPTGKGETGRTGVEKPIAGVVAKIEARKYYNRADGSHEEKLEAIPEDIRERFDDESLIETTAPTPKPKKDDSKKDDSKKGDSKKGDSEKDSDAE